MHALQSVTNHFVCAGQPRRVRQSKPVVLRPVDGAKVPTYRIFTVDGKEQRLFLVDEGGHILTIVISWLQGLHGWLPVPMGGVPPAPLLIGGMIKVSTIDAFTAGFISLITSIQFQLSLRRCCAFLRIYNGPCVDVARIAKY